MSKDVRLQKYMADSGVASRRKSEELIAAGKVKINGVTAKIGDKVDTRKDTVLVSNKKITPPTAFVYYMLHKPRGYVTTLSDEMDRRCVAQLMKGVNERVYPVGRLDRESEGLLLMTNDGQFANDLMHPSKHVAKTYRVTVRPSITEEQIKKMADGMMIDGVQTAPARVSIVEKQENRVVLEIEIFEGRNRQIRKMCEQLQLDVARLKRVAVGGLKLGMLQPGKYRVLTDKDLAKIKQKGALTRDRDKAE